MRILGIDPGLATLGFGVIDLQKNNQLQLVEFGCIRTTTQLSLPQRIEQIYRELTDILGKYSPEVVVVEELFFSKNVKTAVQIGEVRGVVLLTAVQHNLEVREYTPLQVKLAVVGYGRASKDQIQKMVKVLLRLPQIPKPDDAADALAVAICHAHAYTFDRLIRNIQ
ncbi:MAG: crossover junction endodeoxyribonuclease RuvC [bacterium]|nr:crossover junction endodeoxyribonuclease RuvC [bacterium]